MTKSNVPLYLERIDAGQNMARFYCLAVEVDLFGDIVSIRRWGRIGGSGRQITSQWESVTDALGDIERYAAAKRQRGYRNPDAERA